MTILLKKVINNTKLHILLLVVNGDINQKTVQDGHVVMSSESNFILGMHKIFAEIVRTNINFRHGYLAFSTTNMF